MSKIQVNEIVNHFDTGAPDCPKGLTVTGFSTFTGSSSFSGDVSIGGTLTYEDVTNIDSVGVITAQSGINIGPSSGIAATLTSSGGGVFTGVVTTTNEVLLTGTNAGNGTTTLSVEAGYDLNGEVDIQTWAREGGAVKAALTYDDEDLDLRFGGTTGHDFKIIQNDNTKILIENSGGVAINTTFGGASGTTNFDQNNVTVGERLITMSRTIDGSTGRAACICEYALGASGTYTGIAVSFNGNNSNTTALVEILLHGYSSRYVQLDAVKYSTQATVQIVLNKDGVTTVSESGNANSNSRWCYDFGGSFVHPVVKVKATVGGLATRFEHPPEITFIA